MQDYKLAVIIGRYQISHTGHELLKRKALEIADQVVEIIGSSFQARNLRNPFTWEERKEMILSTLSDREKSVHFVALFVITIMMNAGIQKLNG